MQQMLRCSSWAGEAAHLIAQVVQDANLNEGLLVEALLVADDLDGAHLPCLVISALEHLMVQTHIVSAS